MCDICGNWAWAVSTKLPPTNHHPNCPHYNDSLIDVWKVTMEGQTFYTPHEADARHEVENAEGATINHAKIHQEVLDALPEFEGF